jgi:PAS domain S-box-containing protein
VSKKAQQRPDRTSPWATIVACAACLSVLWGALFVEARKLEESEIAQASRDAANLATAFQEHVSRTVSAVDQLMVTMIAAQQESGRWDTIPTWIRSSPLLQGLALQVAIAGPDSVLRASTVELGGRIDVSDRAHIRHHFDPSASQPFISVPLVGRASGRWSMQITRRITDVDGTFRGVVIVSVDPQYFSNFFDQIELGHRGSVALIGLDGIVRAYRSGTSSEIGQDRSKSELFNQLRMAATGSYRDANTLDGVERIIGYRKLEGYPLVVSVGISTQEALAGAYHQTNVYLAGGAALSIILILVAGGWFLYREAERRHRWQFVMTTKEDLRKQKILLDTALENMVQGLLMFDSSNRLLVCNRRYNEIYGLSPKDVKRGTALVDILTRMAEAGSLVGGVEQVAAEIKAAVDSGKTTTKLVEMRDGRTINITTQPMPNGGWLVTHADVTARKKLERERDWNQELLDLAIQHVPSPIILKDARDLRYVLVNQAAAQYLGRDRQWIIGKNAHDVFPAGVADTVVAKDRQIIETRKGEIVGEYAIDVPGQGQRTHMTTRRCILDEHGQPRYVLIVVNDITEHKLITEQLQQSQKMEAVGKLTGGLAHDFNNLLMVMVGNLEVLMATNTEPEQAELISSILQAALRGAELNGQLLAFSRRQPLQPTRIDINENLRQTTLLLRRSLGEQINVDLRLGDNVGAVSVDPAQFEAAAVNIAINARDAMPGGGTLTIETSNRRVDNGASVRLGVAPGDYSVVQISDSGCGMAPEIVARIFEPFFTTKAPGRGTGLGLSMVYGFMKQSAGAVIAKSKVGKGTTFQLLLPHDTTSEATLVPDQPERAAVPRDGGEKVILAVDDNTEVRATAVRHLRALGYRVLEAADGKAALQELESAPDIDLLFTDIIMPGGMDGRQLAQVARAKRPDLKVLYTSGFPGNGSSDDRLAEMDAPLLAKPYRQQALARAVATALA